jgi:hypothetical protein
MTRVLKSVPVFVLILAFATVTCAMPNQAAQGEEKMAQGSLVKVDTEKMTVSIKPETGEEIQFSYDANTKVEGSQSGVQGLSSETGTKVTVYYTESSGKMLATRITVNKANQ